MCWKIKKSKYLISCLEKLSKGSSKEQQVFENALKAMDRVKEDPINELYRKTLPANYKAANVLQQFRIFFKIDNDNKVIFFSWMNDEKCLHVSGGKNDCYKIFRSLYKKGEIEEYIQDDLIESRGQLYLSAPGGKRNIEAFGSDEQIYAKYKSQDGIATSFMLRRDDKHSYAICSIDPMEENYLPTIELLTKVCQKADQSSMNLKFEIFTAYSETTKLFLEKLLTANGFEFQQEIDEALEFIRLHQ